MSCKSKKVASTICNTCFCVCFCGRKTSVCAGIPVCLMWVVDGKPRKSCQELVSLHVFVCRSDNVFM